MNIFVLSTEPQKAAQAHCDQHIHKMILESAQMLSTAFRYRNDEIIRHTHYIYKSAYQKHPCTQWVTSRYEHFHWIIQLCEELNTIRLTTGSRCDHGSMEIIRYIAANIPQHLSEPKHFVFCGPAFIRLQDIHITDKYKRYYRFKCKEWLDTERPMTYKDRPVPAFMQDLFIPQQP